MGKSKSQTVVKAATVVKAPFPPTKTQFDVDTKGICFVCFSTDEKKTGNGKDESEENNSKTEAEGNNEDGGDTANNNADAQAQKFTSFLKMSRYLKLDMGKVFSSETTAIPVHLLKTMEKSDVRVRLCEECEILTGKFTSLMEQLDKVRIEAGFTLKTIWERLLMAEKDANAKELYWGKVVSHPQALMHVGIVEKMRKEAIDKCNERIERFNPTVKLKRLNSLNLKLAKTENKLQDSSDEQEKLPERATNLPQKEQSKLNSSEALPKRITPKSERLSLSSSRPRYTDSSSSSEDDDKAYNCHGSDAKFSPPVDKNRSKRKAIVSSSSSSSSSSSDNEVIAKKSHQKNGKESSSSSILTRTVTVTKKTVLKKMNKSTAAAAAAEDVKPKVLPFMSSSTLKSKQEEKEKEAKFAKRLSSSSKTPAASPEQEPVLQQTKRPSNLPPIPKYTGSDVVKRIYPYRCCCQTRFKTENQLLHHFTSCQKKPANPFLYFAEGGGGGNEEDDSDSDDPESSSDDSSLPSPPPKKKKKKLPSRVDKFYSKRLFSTPTTVKPVSSSTTEVPSSPLMMTSTPIAAKDLSSDLSCSAVSALRKALTRPLMTSTPITATGTVAAEEDPLNRSSNTKALTEACPPLPLMTSTPIPAASAAAEDDLSSNQSVSDSFVESLIENIVKIGDGYKYKCPHCPRTFKLPVNLGRHLKKKHLNRKRGSSASPVKKKTPQKTTITEEKDNILTVSSPPPAPEPILPSSAPTPMSPVILPLDTSRAVDEEFQIEFILPEKDNPSSSDDDDEGKNKKPDLTPPLKEEDEEEVKVLLEPDADFGLGIQISNVTSLIVPDSNGTGDDFLPAADDAANANSSEILPHSTATEPQDTHTGNCGWTSIGMSLSRFNQVDDDDDEEEEIKIVDEDPLSISVKSSTASASNSISNNSNGNDKSADGTSTSSIPTVTIILDDEDDNDKLQRLPNKEGKDNLLASSVATAQEKKTSIK